jgi:hypothetical protein
MCVLARDLKYGNRSRLSTSRQNGYTESAMCDALSFADPADANRDPNRLVVRTDEKLTPLLELERTIYEFALDLMHHSLKSPRQRVLR